MATSRRNFPPSATPGPVRASSVNYNNNTPRRPTTNRPRASLAVAPLPRLLSSSPEPQLPLRRSYTPSVGAATRMAAQSLRTVTVPARPSAVKPKPTSKAITTLAKRSKKPWRQSILDGRYVHGGELERRIELVKGPANAALDLLLLEESDGDAGGRLDEPTRRVFEAFRTAKEAFLSTSLFLSSASLADTQPAALQDPLSPLNNIIKLSNLTTFLYLILSSTPNVDGTQSVESVNHLKEAANAFLQYVMPLENTIHDGALKMLVMIKCQAYIAAASRSRKPLDPDDYFSATLSSHFSSLANRKTDVLVNRASSNRFLNFCTTAASWIEEANGDIDMLRETYKWEAMSTELRNYCEHVAKTISEEGQSQIESSAAGSSESAEETVVITSSPVKGKGRAVQIAPSPSLEESEAESGVEDVASQTVVVDDVREEDESEEEDESQEAREAREVVRILSAPPSEGMMYYEEDLETDEGRMERELDDEGNGIDQDGVDPEFEEEGEEELEEEFFAGLEENQISRPRESQEGEEGEEDEGDEEEGEQREHDLTLMLKEEEFSDDDEFDQEEEDEGVPVDDDANSINSQDLQRAAVEDLISSDEDEALDISRASPFLQDADEGIRSDIDMEEVDDDAPHANDEFSGAQASPKVRDDEEVKDEEVVIRSLALRALIEETAFEDDSEEDEPMINADHRADASRERSANVEEHRDNQGGSEADVSIRGRLARELADELQDEEDDEEDEEEDDLAPFQFAANSRAQEATVQAQRAPPPAAGRREVNPAKEQQSTKIVMDADFRLRRMPADGRAQPIFAPKANAEKISWETQDDSQDRSSPALPLSTLVASVAATVPAPAKKSSTSKAKTVPVVEIPVKKTLRPSRAKSVTIPPVDLPRGQASGLRASVDEDEQVLSPLRESSRDLGRESPFLFPGDFGGGGEDEELAAALRREAKGKGRERLASIPRDRRSSASIDREDPFAYDAEALARERDRPNTGRSSGAPNPHPAKSSARPTSVSNPSKRLRPDENEDPDSSDDEDATRRNRMRSIQKAKEAKAAAAQKRDAESNRRPAHRKTSPIGHSTDSDENDDSALKPKGKNIYFKGRNVPGGRIKWTFAETELLMAEMDLWLRDFVKIDARHGEVGCVSHTLKNRNVADLSTKATAIEKNYKKEGKRSRRWFLRPY